MKLTIQKHKSDSREPILSKEFEFDVAEDELITVKVGQFTYYMRSTGEVVGASIEQEVSCGCGGHCDCEEPEVCECGGECNCKS